MLALLNKEYNVVFFFLRHRYSKTILFSFSLAEFSQRE